MRPVSIVAVVLLVASHLSAAEFRAGAAAVRSTPDRPMPLAGYYNTRLSTMMSLGEDVAWVSLPGEIFVELGLEIKQQSPFRHTIIVELANGAIGYIPTSKAYDQGNYEPLSARCAKGSGETLVRSALRMLGDLK
jgi:hypothetical protein